MKASIGIQEQRVGGTVQAAQVDIRLVFAVDYERADRATQKRIEFRAAQKIEDWLIAWKLANASQDERRAR